MPRRGASMVPMNPVVLELGLLALTALSFWLLDRYVIACEKI